MRSTRPKIRVSNKLFSWVSQGTARKGSAFLFVLPGMSTNTSSVIDITATSTGTHTAEAVALKASELSPEQFQAKTSAPQQLPANSVRIVRSKTSIEILALEGVRRAQVFLTEAGFTELAKTRNHVAMAFEDTVLTFHVMATPNVAYVTSRATADGSVKPRVYCLASELEADLCVQVLVTERNNSKNPVYIPLEDTQQDIAKHTYLALLQTAAECSQTCRDRIKNLRAQLIEKLKLISKCLGDEEAKTEAVSLPSHSPTACLPHG